MGFLSLSRCVVVGQPTWLSALGRVSRSQGWLAWEHPEVLTGDLPELICQTLGEPEARPGTNMVAIAHFCDKANLFQKDL